MTLQEFESRLSAFINFQADKNQTFRNEEFLRFCEQFLVLHQEINDFKKCYYEGFTTQRERMQLHAYSVDKDSGVCCIFLCQWKTGDDNAVVRGEEIKNAFQKMMNFVREATRIDLHDKAFYKKLEETAPAYELAKYLYEEWNSVVNLKFYVLTNDIVSDTELQNLAETIEGKPAEYFVYDISKIYKFDGIGMLNQLSDTVNFVEGLHKLLQKKNVKLKQTKYFLDSLFDEVQRYRSQCSKMDDIYRVLIDKISKGDSVYVGADFYYLFVVNRGEALQIVEKIFKCSAEERERCFKSAVREYQLLHRKDGEYGFWIDVFTSPDENKNDMVSWIEPVSCKKLIKDMVSMPECLGLLINPYTDRLQFSKECLDKIVFDGMEKDFASPENLFLETNDMSEQVKIYSFLKELEEKRNRLWDRMLSGGKNEKRKYHEQVKLLDEKIEDCKKKLEAMK